MSEKYRFVRPLLPVAFALAASVHLLSPPTSAAPPPGGSAILSGKATVIDENRTVDIKDGTLRDPFASRAVHLYDIAGASAGGACRA